MTKELFYLEWSFDFWLIKEHITKWPGYKRPARKAALSQSFIKYYIATL